MTLRKQTGIQMLVTTKLQCITNQILPNILE